MVRIIFATSNKNKIKEIKEIINNDDIDIVSIAEEGINIDVEENGTTYEENAFIKARAIAKENDNIIMAEDSGLEIDYLNGQPGIYSARYMGHDTSYIEKNNAILNLMKDVGKEKRTARYICSLVAILPNKKEISTRGILEGEIGVEQKKGISGFGYDPIFFLPNKNCYLSEISLEEKNKISHREKALIEMMKILKDIGIII
jgi:XTP/dITP diphosphohydrolase